MTSLQIRNESDRNKAMGYIAGLDLAKPKKLAITEVDRSGEQNKALHAALADIAAQVKHAGKKWDVLIWKRLLLAAEHLQRTDCLTRAAVDAGFADASHFSNCYKRYIGASPAQVFRSLQRFER